jgi:hypothetical protein
MKNEFIAAIKTAQAAPYVKRPGPPLWLCSGKCPFCNHGKPHAHTTECGPKGCKPV